jgi:cyclase
LVKGLCFDGFRVLGHPETFAQIYDQDGADEFLYVDTVASLYQRPPRFDVIRRVAAKTSVPLTVAGGIRSLDDIHLALRAGADKVAINTAALADPNFLKIAASRYGSQCIALSLEAHRNLDGRYECWTDFGRQRTGVDVFEWAERAVGLGVGEIIVSAVHNDGLGTGFDIELTKKIAASSPVPVVAACGAGTAEHFYDVIVKANADAVAAASIFHYQAATPVPGLWMSFDQPRLRNGEPIDAGNIEFLNAGYGGVRDLQVQAASIAEVKRYLAGRGVPMRLPVKPKMSEARP